MAHRTEAKLVCLPGATGIGPATTLTFAFDMPTQFVGTRLVIFVKDGVTQVPANNALVVLSLKHNNREMLADGMTSQISGEHFAPWNIQGPNTIIISDTGYYLEFHEQFQQGDNFTLVLRNIDPANSVNTSIFWVTDYGEKCRKCG